MTISPNGETWLRTWPFHSLDLMSEEDSMLLSIISSIKFEAALINAKIALSQMLSQKLDKEITEYLQEVKP